MQKRVKNALFPHGRVKSYWLFTCIFVSTVTISKISCQSSSVKDQIEEVQLIYGANTSLVNGVYFDNEYKFDKGHPYLFADEFQIGTIVVKNKEYNNLQLKYNIYNQKVLINYIDKGNSSIPFYPPTEFVNEFTINTTKFKKHSFAGFEDNFYQVIYEGRIACLYLWFKKRIDSYHNIDFHAYEYLKPQKKSYLVINNELKLFKGKKSFVVLLPPDIRDSVKHYIKETDIKFKQITEKQMEELTSFCEQQLSRVDTF